MTVKQLLPLLRDPVIGGTCSFGWVTGMNARAHGEGQVGHCNECTHGSRAREQVVGVRARVIDS